LLTTRLQSALVRATVADLVVAVIAALCALGDAVPARDLPAPLTVATPAGFQRTSATAPIASSSVAIVTLLPRRENPVAAAVDELAQLPGDHAAVAVVQRAAIVRATVSELGIAIVARFTRMQHAVATLRAPHARLPRV
jgi:hypothetical protein